LSAIPTITDFADRLESLTSSSQVWRSFLDFAGSRGFEHAGYGDLPGPKERLSETLVFNSLPPVWFDHYVRNHYIDRDPLALKLVSARVPFTLEEIASAGAHAHTAEQQRIMGERNEFGIRTVYCVPLRSPANGPAMMSLVSGVHFSLTETDRSDLHVAAMYTDMRLRPATRHDSTLPQLTHRERECLHWVAIGKTDSSIGEILKISAKTVNFHVESAKRKYGVSSRTLAATMALKAGVIHV
jgi:DNA-binding CsgD family transcriptional regulator